MANKKQTVETLDQGVLLTDNVCSNCATCESNLKQIIKERDEKTQTIFDKDKEIIRIQKEHEVKLKDVQMALDTKIKQYELLSSKFNDLAKLFDEYIKSSEDMVSLHQMLLRNNLRTQELMQIKIKAFNGEGENKE